MKLLAIIGFVLISILCIYFRKEPIESDLTARSSAALQNANLEIPEIRFEGRDAFLSGAVNSESIKTQVENIVANVYGVRVVNTQLTITKLRQQQSTGVKEKLQKTLNELLADKKIEFTYNSAEIRASGQQVLAEIADVIKEFPNTRIEINGHTDASGNAAYNQKLSQMRAQSVMQYLINKGIAAKMLSALGRGSSQPIADNSSISGQDKNRRVEFKVEKEN
jgi:outer membrane protein OmpA-like peptidoglycan-associated protein